MKNRSRASNSLAAHPQNAPSGSNRAEATQRQCGWAQRTTAAVLITAICSSQTIGCSSGGGGSSSDEDSVASKSATLTLSRALPSAGSCEGLEEEVQSRNLTNETNITPGEGGAQNGLFGYAVPIQLPPARVGPTPHFSLSYNSALSGTASAKSGLGVGWAMSGASAITRCAKQKEIHGTIAARPQYNKKDRLCKDGVPLVNQYDEDAKRWDVDDDAYWSSANQFFPVDDPTTRITVTEDFSEIHERGEGRTHMVYAVTDLNGSVYDGGAWTSVVGRWQPEKLTDSFGNVVEFVYSSDNSGSSQFRNAKYLTKAVYDRGTAIVEFAYTDLPESARKVASHPDALFRYSFDQALTNVRVLVDDGSESTLVRNYSISYTGDADNPTSGDWILSNTLQYPFVTSIRECRSEDLSQCKNPIIFTYSNPELDGEAWLNEGESYSYAIELDDSAFGEPMPTTIVQLENGRTMGTANRINPGRFGGGSRSDLFTQLACAGDFGDCPGPLGSMLWSVDEEGIATWNQNDRWQNTSVYLDEFGVTPYGANVHMGYFNDGLHPDVFFQPLHGAARATFGLDIGTDDTSTVFRDDFPAWATDNSERTDANKESLDRTSQMLTGDFDGDGRTEFLRIDPMSEAPYTLDLEAWVAENDTSTFAVLRDCDGDGNNDDVLVSDPGQPYPYPETTCINSTNDGTHEGDFVLGRFYGQPEPVIVDSEGDEVAANLPGESVGWSRFRRPDERGALDESVEDIWSHQWGVGPGAMLINYVTAPEGFTGEFEEPGFGTKVSVVDMNGDGLDDIVRQTVYEDVDVDMARPSVEVVLSQGIVDGAYTWSQPFDMFPEDIDYSWVGSNGYMLNFADFDGDSVLDVFVQGSGPQNGMDFVPVIHFGRGNGTFSDGLPLDLSDSGVELYRLNADRAPRSFDDHEDAMEYLTKGVPWLKGSRRKSPGRVHVGDWDGDGRADILHTGSPEPNEVSEAKPGFLLRSLGNGAFDHSEAPGIDTVAFGYQRTAICEVGHGVERTYQRRYGFETTPADMDGDGWPDLLAQKWEAPFDLDEFVVTNCSIDLSELPTRFETHPGVTVVAHPLSGRPVNRMTAANDTHIQTSVTYEGFDADAESATHAAPAHLVSKVTQALAQGAYGDFPSYSSIDYEYQEALGGAEGGYLGFKYVTATLSPLGDKTEIVSTVVPRDGARDMLVPTQMSVFSENGKTKQIQVTNYSETNNALGIIQVKPSHVTTTEFYCEGTDCTLAATETESSFQYNEYGYLDERTTSSEGQVPTREEFTYAPVLNEPELWVVGELIERRTGQAAHKMPDRLVFDRDPETGSIVESTQVGQDNNGSGKSVVTHNRYRDDGRLEKTWKDSVLNDVVFYSYDDAARQNTVKWNPMGEDCTDGSQFQHSITSSYDPVWRRTTKVEDDDGVQCSYYDDWGNLVASAATSPQDGEVKLTHTYSGVQTVVRGDGIWARSWKSSVSELTPEGTIMSDSYTTLNGFPLLNTTKFLDLEGNLAGSIGQSRAYDDQGRLFKESLPRESRRYGGFDEGETTHTYDAVGRPSTITTSADDGSVLAPTMFQYEQAGEGLVKVTQLRQDGDATRTHTAVRTGRGSILSQSHGAGSVQRFEYDFAGRLMRSYDDDGTEQANETTVAYDNLGRFWYSTNDDEGGVKHEYDEFGRVAQVLYRDADLNVVRSTTYAYDGFHRLESVTGTTPGSSGQTQRVVYSYDEDSGKLASTSVQECATPGCDSTTVNIVTTSYDYGHAGAVTWRLRRFRDDMVPYLFGYEYDALGRVVKETNPNSDETLYEFNERGQVSKVTSPDGTETNYGDFSVYGPAQKQWRTVKTNDRSGGDPDDTATTEVVNSLDALGRLAETTTTSVSTDSERVCVRRRFFLRKLCAEWGWDTESNTVTRNRELTVRNAFGEVQATQVHADAENSKSREYTFDDAGQLTSAVVNGGVAYDQISYAYDKFGNITQSGDTSYNYLERSITLHREGAIEASSSYDFDDIGRLTRKSTTDIGSDQVFTYDAFGRLQQITDNNGVLQDTTFSYDASGQRVEKVEGGVTTRYVDPSYIVTLDGSESEVTEIVSGPSGPVMQQAGDGTQRRFFDADDQVGNVTHVADARGRKQSRSLYEPYGKEHDVSSFAPIVSEDAVNVRRSFAGNELDSTGLHYFNARYYDSQLGRFTTPDTLTFGTNGVNALNRYAYAANNPVTYADPQGNFVMVAFAISAAIVIPIITAVAQGREVSQREVFISTAIAVASVGVGSVTSPVVGVALDVGLTALEDKLITGSVSPANLALAAGTAGFGSMPAARARPRSGGYDVGSKRTIGAGNVGGDCPNGVCSGSKGCFAAGTPVLTEDGPVPIEELQLGDYVTVPSEDPVAAKVDADMERAAEESGLAKAQLDEWLGLAAEREEAVKRVYAGKVEALDQAVEHHSKMLDFLEENHLVIDRDAPESEATLLHLSPDEFREWLIEQRGDPENLPN